jgi:hypothetical protein
VQIRSDHLPPLSCCWPTTRRSYEEQESASTGWPYGVYSVLFVVLLSTALPMPAFAAPGTLDPIFGIGKIK